MTGRLWALSEVREKTAGLYKLLGQRPSGAQGQEPSTSECSFSTKLLLLRDSSLTKKPKNFQDASLTPVRFLRPWFTFVLQKSLDFVLRSTKVFPFSTASEKVRSQEIPTRTETPRYAPTLKTEGHQLPCSAPGACVLMRA